MAIDLVLTEGTKLFVKTGTPTPTFQLVDGITGLGRSGGGRTVLDGTALSDSAPRSTLGKRAPVQWEGTANFDPNDTVQAALTEAQGTGAMMVFRYEINSTPPFIRFFDGRVSAFGEWTATGEGLMTCRLGIAQDGADRTIE